MVLTAFQRDICRLMARARRARGDSYVAEAAALNAAPDVPRISRDLDLFHDTVEAVQASWMADRQLLQEAGCDVVVLRELAAYVEAIVRRGSDSVVLQWTRDSAFRFFPLLEHEDFGLTLHPLDLAANKVLALVGRLEVRDWVDVIMAHERVQPLGLLAWAACGKDPGFSPEAILEEAGRSARYSVAEVAELSFEGVSPDAGELSGRWHAALREAREIVALLPPDQAGRCVLDENGRPFAGTPEDVKVALARRSLRYHEGHIGGAWPRIR